MPLAETLETTRMHRVAGLSGARTTLVTARPCRAPPQTTSAVGLVGGGHLPMPGQVPALKRALLRERQAEPLLLVFEDLHWINSEAPALLDNLVASLLLVVEVVQLAVAGGATAIVTYNTQDFERAELHFPGLRIVQPRVLVSEG